MMGLLRSPFRRKRRRYRSIPGVPKQFKLLLRRAGVKWIRGWSYKFIDMLLFAGAALVVGELAAPPVTCFFFTYDSGCGQSC